jgi:hypothetical protein
LFLEIVPIPDLLSIYEILRLARDIEVITSSDLLQRLSLKYAETDYYIGLLLANDMLKPYCNIMKLGSHIGKAEFFQPKGADLEYSITERGKKYLRKVKKFDELLPLFAVEPPDSSSGCIRI